MSNSHGECCLCGAQGKLSFEHVPPRAAFNDGRVVHTTFGELLGRGPEAVISPITGTQIQQGAGTYALCEQCNNSTGSWYGNTYVQFARHVNDALTAAPNDGTVKVSCRLAPIRVLKQVICCFFSVNGSLLHHEEVKVLKDFVLDRDVCKLPDKVRIYVYATRSEKSRFSQLTPMCIVGTEKSFFFSEFAFAPLGFVLTWDTPPPNPDLTDITDFSRVPYDQMQDLTLELPVKAIDTAFPCDFRTRDEAATDFLKGVVQQKALHIDPKPTARSSIELHFPVLGPGLFTGIAEPKTKTPPSVLPSNDTPIEEYDHVVVVGVVSGKIAGERVSVARMGNVSRQSAPLAYGYRGLDGRDAEVAGLYRCLGWLLTALPQGKRIAVISNLSEEILEQYSNRVWIIDDVPVEKKVQVENSTLIQAWDEVSESLFQALVRECRTEAKGNLEFLEEMEAGRIPEVFEGQRMTKLKDLPQMRFADLNDGKQ